MRARVISGVLGVILLIATLCAINREIGRREGKATLNKTVAGTATITEVTPAPSPWSVVCDNQGHYTFKDDKGELWNIREWSTYQEAWDFAMSIKALRESIDPIAVDAERRKQVELRARKWEACPP